MRPAAYPGEGGYGAAPVARRGPRRVPRGPEALAEPQAGNEGRGRVRLPRRVPRFGGPPEDRGRGAAGPGAPRRGRGGSRTRPAPGEPGGGGARPVGERRARAARAGGRGGGRRVAKQGHGADGDSLRGGAPGDGAGRLAHLGDCARPFRSLVSRGMDARDRTEPARPKGPTV